MAGYALGYIVGQYTWLFSIGHFDWFRRTLHFFSEGSVSNADGGLVLPDVREGERLVTELYLDLLELKAKEAGEPFDRATAKVPPQFDYRQLDRANARPARKRGK